MDQNYSMAQCISSDTKFDMFRGISILFLKHYPILQTLRDNSLENDKLGTVVQLGKSIFIFYRQNLSIG